MPERKLPAKHGPELYQQELGGLPAPQEVVRQPYGQRVYCPLCRELGLRSDLIARPARRWACARGHGIVGALAGD